MTRTSTQVCNVILQGIKIRPATKKNNDDDVDGDDDDDNDYDDDIEMMTMTGVEADVAGVALVGREMRVKSNGMLSEWQWRKRKDSHKAPLFLNQ